MNHWIKELTRDLGGEQWISWWMNECLYEWMNVLRMNEWIKESIRDLEGEGSGSQSTIHIRLINEEIDSEWMDEINLMNELINCVVRGEGKEQAAAHQHPLNYEWMNEI